ncbi:MAG TPA: hypothetical protein VFN19_05080, partial [Candidatus Nanopelagicales bacterium]|nr:hypothetical protein [Candidatus Nanopelagicales bacterium]
AEHNVARSLDSSGSRRSAATEVAVDLAGRIPHVWVPSDRSEVSTLDLIGTGLTRLAARREPGLGPGAPSGPPVTLHLLDSDAAAAVGADRPGGLLVRPDGIPLDDGLRGLLAVRPTAVA